MKNSISNAVLIVTLVLVILTGIITSGAWAQEGSISNSETVMDMLERKIEKDTRKAHHVFESLTPMLGLTSDQIDELMTTLDTVSQLMRLEMEKRALRADTDSKVFSELVGEINRGKVSLLARPEMHEVIKGILELEQYDQLRNWQQTLTDRVNQAAVDYVLAELSTQLVVEKEQKDQLRDLLQTLVVVEPDGFQWRGAVTTVAMRLQHNLQQQYSDPQSDLARILTPAQRQLLQDSNQGGDPTFFPFTEPNEE